MHLLPFLGFEWTYNTWELRLRRPFQQKSWIREILHCSHIWRKLGPERWSWLPCFTHSSVVADPRLELRELTCRLMLVLCQLPPPHCSQCGSLNYIIPPILFHWLAGLSMKSTSSEVICKGNTSIIHCGNVLLNSFRILNFGQATEWAHQVEHWNMICLYLTIL